MKIVKKIQMKIVIFRAVKNCCMLHGRVSVMKHVVDTVILLPSKGFGTECRLQSFFYILGDFSLPS